MRRCAGLAALTILCTTAFAQVSNPRIAKLATADTILQFSAGPHAPQLLSLSGHGQSSWDNIAVEAPPPNLNRGTERVPLAWHLVAALTESDVRHVAFIYESRQPHLRLRWEWTARAKFGPIEHRIVIQNLSSIEYWLPVPDSLHLDWRIAAHATLQHLYIDKGAGAPTAIGTHLPLIPVGYNWTGWSSTFAHPVPGHTPEIIPWNAVFTPQNQQTGWFSGIEFSGRTRLTLQRSQDHLSSFAGLDPEPSPALTRLPPGDSFETPTIFLGAFSGGPDGAGNELRPWVRAVLGSPRTWADPHYPLVVNNSWGAGMDINEPIANLMIADASSLGFEMFHLDAGWFRGPGDWYPNPGKFPHGLAAIADDAHRHSLRFGLWVDWSQAGLDTETGALNVRDPKVRDWLVADVAPDWKPQNFKGQTIDLGVPAARDYAAREVDRIVNDNHLDMLEHDGYLVAQGCTRDGHPHAPPDPQRLNVEHYDGEDIVLSSNSTDVSYHAVRAYYSIYEQLRSRHPGLLLEICNDGGRMVDFGSAAHGDYFSITDSYDPLSNRRAFYDASYLLPPAMLESYVEKWPTPQPANFLYMLRSAMMGWVSVMQNTNDWTPAQHAAAQQAIALYKARLRPLIREAQLFHITPRPDGIHWDGVEYFDATRKQGVVYAFRGSATDEPQHRFVLAGLDPHQTWRLHFADASSPDTVASGSQLMQEGLQVDLSQPLSSELIFLSQK
jgi:hypothetical protein